ncbi:dihydrofolate reductase family protein [Chloroflexota bacterium]
MANYVYVAASLDGFIATNNGGLEWLDEIPNPEQSDYGYAEFMTGIDAIVMGRKTFEKVLSFGSWQYDVPVFVISNSVRTIPKELGEKVEIVNGELRQLVSTLGERGYENLYIDGGKTIQSFLEEALIDEIIITRVPILLGDGIPLFGKLAQQQRFTHNDSEIFNNGLVKSYYIKLKDRL